MAETLSPRGWGNARAVVFAGRLNKASYERGAKVVGSLKSFVAWQNGMLQELTGTLFNIVFHSV